MEINNTPNNRIISLKNDLVPEQSKNKSDVQECTCTDEELQQKASKGIGS